MQETVTSHTCEVCDKQTPGILPYIATDGHHAGPPPDGFIVVQRCDACTRYSDDLAAASAWGTDARWQEGNDTAQAICRPPSGWTWPAVLQSQLATTKADPASPEATTLAQRLSQLMELRVGTLDKGGRPTVLITCKNGKVVTAHLDAVSDAYVECLTEKELHTWTIIPIDQIAMVQFSE